MKDTQEDTTGVSQVMKTGLRLAGLLLLSISVPRIGALSVLAEENDNKSPTVIDSTCGNIDGEVNVAGPIDVADFSYFLNYLFRGGDAPPVPEAANTDLCDGIDIADLQYLSRFLFSGGPPPCREGVDCDYVPGDDSARLVVTQEPDITSGDSILQIDLLVHNSILVTAFSVGFEWDSQDIRLDSAVATQVADSVYNVGPYYYKHDSIEQTNSDRQFLMGGIRVTYGGMEPGDRLWASYYFTASNWTYSSTVMIDTTTFGDGSVYKLVAGGLGNQDMGYRPRWGGRLFIRDSLFCGDINGDRNGPNIEDLTFLVSYLFLDGSAPVHLELANVDGIIGPGGVVDVADLTYFVAFFFANGPALIC